MRAIVNTAAQIAEIIRGRRKARGISQRALASKLGISQSRLSAIEAGSSPLTVDRLIVLANVLDLQLVVQDKVDKPSKPRSRAEW